MPQHLCFYALTEPECFRSHKTPINRTIHIHTGTYVSVCADIRKQPDEHGTWTFEEEALAENKVNQKINEERIASKALLDSILFKISAVFYY